MMFSCCGCKPKSVARADSDEENYRQEEKVEKDAELLSRDNKGYQDEKQVEPNETENNEDGDQMSIDEYPDTPATPSALPPRKSSMKKPKPRLSISAEVKIIPDQILPVPVQDQDDECQSPLSDEVFDGAGNDPPRANLGVAPAGAASLTVEFPRTQQLDVPLSPRGKPPTPHPKRASMPAVLPQWLSEEEDEGGGLLEPPVTPVAKDELALRRHRFFAELLAAAQAAAEHRVRFDPLGPEISGEAESTNKEFEVLLDRLESITTRLERAVPLLENTLEPLTRSLVVTKSLEELLDEHLTPTEKEKISGLLSDRLISPDSSADVADLSDRDFVPLLPLDDNTVCQLEQDYIEENVPSNTTDITQVEDCSDPIHLQRLGSESEPCQADNTVESPELDSGPAEAEPDIEENQLIKPDQESEPDIEEKQLTKPDPESESDIEEKQLTKPDQESELDIEETQSEKPDLESGPDTKEKQSEKPEQKSELDIEETQSEKPVQESEFDIEETQSEKPDQEEEPIEVDFEEKLIPEESELPTSKEELSDNELTSGSGETDVSSESPATVVFEIPPPPPILDLLAQPDLLEMTNSQSTLSMSTQGFQAIVQGPLASYLQLSREIGGDVAEHAKIVQNAFQAQLQYLVLASQRSKPSPSEEQQLLQPTSQYIQAIQEYREKHRASPLFNHLSAISESIPALGWVTVSPAPSPFIKEMNDAGQFYTNRVLKDWKEKDKKHVEWTKAWISALTELQAFVKQQHTTGLVWSGTGGPPPPPPSGPMPPPPPPLDLNMGDLNLGSADNDRSALFAEINRGADVTRGLKKVSSDMQTHKNPAMRSGPAPFKAAATTGSGYQKTGAPVDKPPSFTRDGKKWLIEYQKGNNGLLVDGAEMNNVVYIYKCAESTVTVKGKINSIMLDSCKKTAVVFDSVVSSIEFVNCQSCQMQVLGAVPTISIDKTDGCQMYLSDASLQVEIVSSKSSEMNVLVPRGNGDFAEYPIPEQFRTTVGKMGLTTTAVESTG